MKLIQKLLLTTFSVFLVTVIFLPAVNSGSLVFAACEGSGSLSDQSKVDAYCQDLASRGGSSQGDWVCSNGNRSDQLWGCYNQTGQTAVSNTPVTPVAAPITCVDPITGKDVPGTKLAVKIDVNGDGTPDECIPEGTGDISTNPIIVYLKGIINFMSIGIGLVAAISIVVAGIQWMASRDNPQAIQAAQKRLWNAVIAILLFIFMYAILNFLVPGGLIG